MEQKIEYAVADQHGTIQLVTGEDRERAFAMANRWNATREQEARFTVMDRRVLTTAWKPANTGIVGPHRADDEE